MQWLTSLVPIVLILNNVTGDFNKSLKLKLVNSRGEKINNIGLFAGARPTTQVVLQYKVWPGYYNYYQRNTQIRLNPVGILPVMAADRRAQLASYVARRAKAVARARARRGR
jgi:hypothetical protein